MVRLSAHVDGIADHGNPILQGVSRQASNQSANQHYQRYGVFAEANRFRQSLDREGAVSVDLLIARFMRAVGGVHQGLGRIKLGHRAVDSGAVHSFTPASGSRVRISKIEIMGRMRTNRNMAARNMPIVPM